MLLMRTKSTKGSKNVDVPRVTCKICLVSVCTQDIYKLKYCKCKFCAYCLGDYVDFSINDGKVVIRCPDMSCKRKGRLATAEIVKFASDRMFLKYQRMKKDYMVELDPALTFCPQPSCHGICQLTDTGDMPVRLQSIHTTPVNCPQCQHSFCALCRNKWHPNVSCDVAASHLPADQIGVPYESEAADVIKRCPSCSCPIERTEGCAQVACKRCSHVFCWYCRESLERDFFLRHYDRGPCKEHLGHTPASVRRHRLQVAGSFIGIGVVLLITSPLLLLASPFVLCCKAKLFQSCCWPKGRHQDWLDQTQDD